MPYFEVTYTDGSVEEIQADEYPIAGKHLTFTNNRIPFIYTVYVDVVRRIEAAAVVGVEEVRANAS